MFISARRRIYIFWLMICDALSLCFATYMAALIRFGIREADAYIIDKIVPLLVTICVFIVIFYLNGLYEPRRFISYVRVTIMVMLSVIAGMVISSFLFYADWSLKIGRGIFTINALFIFISTAISRLFFTMIARKKILDHRIAIIGTGESARDVITLLNNHTHSLYHVVGVVKEDEKNGFADKINGYKILGSINEIEDLVKANDVDAIVVTTLEPERHRTLEKLRVCRYRGIEIIDVVSIYEELEGQIPVKYIDDEWLFNSSAKYPGFHIKKIKRLMDILGSSVGIILSLPICLITAILIKIDSKGPVFYVQKRLGRENKPFRVIKFRSMIDRAEKGSGGPVWSSKNDIRITRVGKWIRKLRIDEIPQLINILVGDMSLVGPRPERPAFIRELSEKIPFYPERLYVQPGLTGWAQINYSYTSSIEETRTKLQFDLYYIKNVSFFLDSLILLKTAKIALFGKGR